MPAFTGALLNDLKSRVRGTKDAASNNQETCLQRLETKFRHRANVADGFAATDASVRKEIEAAQKAGKTKLMKQWQLYDYLREVRADILRLEAILNLPPGDPQDPPKPPF